MEKKDNGQATPGSEKDQLKELSLLASDGEDFNPGKEGVGQGDTEKQGGGGEMSLTAIVLGPAFFKTFGALANGCGEHWRVPEDTCTMLGAAWGPVLDSVFPNATDNKLLEALMVTAGALGNPVMTEIQIRRSGVPEKAGEKDGDPSKPKPAE